MWAMKEWAAWQDAMHLVQLQPKMYVIHSKTINKTAKTVTDAGTLCNNCTRY